MAGCTRISIMCMAACPKKNADVCKPAGQVQLVELHAHVDAYYLCLSWAGCT